MACNSVSDGFKSTCIVFVAVGVLLIVNVVGNGVQSVGNVPFSLGVSNSLEWRGFSMVSATGVTRSK